MKQLVRRPIFLNAYALVGNTLIVACTGYLFWIIAARRFAEESIGTASAALSLMGGLSILADLGLGTGLIRFLSSQSDKQQIALIQAATTVRIYASLTLVAGFFIGLPLWAPGLPLSQHLELWITFAVLTVMNGVFLLQNALFVAMRMAHYVLLTSVIFNGIKLGGILVLPPDLGVVAILLPVAAGFAVVVIFSVLSLLPKLFATYRPRLNVLVRAPQEFFAYSAFNQIAVILTELPGMMLPILVLNTLGPEANARFYMAWMTSSILRTGCVSVSQSAFAEGSARPENLYSDLWRSLALSLLMVVAGGFALAVVGPWMLSLFGRSYSDEGAYLLYWLLASIAPFCIVNLYITAQRVHKNTSLLLLVSATLAGTSFIGAFWGLQNSGLSGLVIGWTVAQCVTMMISLILIFRQRYLICEGR